VRKREKITRRWKLPLNRENYVLSQCDPHFDSKWEMCSQRRENPIGLQFRQNMVLSIKWVYNQSQRFKNYSKISLARSPCRIIFLTERISAHKVRSSWKHSQTINVKAEGLTVLERRKYFCICDTYAESRNYYCSGLNRPMRVFRRSMLRNVTQLYADITRHDRIVVSEHNGRNVFVFVM
jgi:hypothetical protein